MTDRTDRVFTGTNETPTCYSCRFFKSGKRWRRGWCYANPPTLVGRFGEWIGHVRPKVKASDPACRFYDPVPEG